MASVNHPPLTSSLSEWATEQTSRLSASCLQRKLEATTLISGVQVERAGKTLINFSSNDYLGLSQHPLVQEAATAALQRFGAGAGASRLVTGNHPLYALLEKKLSQLKQREATLVVGSGYLANMGVISALAGRQDIILADKLVHACIVDGARLSGANFLRFVHNDLTALEHMLIQHRKHHRHCLVITDAVFSMDGDLAPLVELRALCDQFDAWLVIDDAHGFAVCGAEQAETTQLADVLVGTLSKAVGGYGGYICADAAVIELLTSSVRPLLFSTALPPAIIAGNLRALELIEQNPDWCERPLNFAKHFTARLGLAEAVSPIVPIIMGGAEKALAASAALALEGYGVTAIRPPTVPEGTARLRITFSALHDMQQVEHLAFLLHQRDEKTLK
jgi:8-amino-7-oxononanoate synthase